MPSMRIWTLTAAIAAAALALQMLALPPEALLPAPFAQLGWVIAALFALVEIAVVHVQFRRHAHSWSMSEVPLVLGLAFLSPTGLVAARLAGSALALVAHRRQTRIKLAFNLAMFWLETTVAVLVYRWVLAGADPIGGQAWLAAMTATAAGTFLVSALAVPLAISLNERRLQGHIFRWVFVASVVATLANTSLGLLAVTVLRQQPAAIWLVAVVAVVMLIGYRGYGSWRRRHDSLQGLHGLARLDAATSYDAAVRQLLTEIRDLLGAETAVVSLRPPGSGSGTGTSLWLGADDRFHTSPTSVPLESFVARSDHRRGAVLVSADTADAASLDMLSHYQARNAMVAVMGPTCATVSTIMVANHVGDVRTFERGDLHLFETLANYATMALDNIRLVGRLRDEADRRQHEALHDALTGLPNRALFEERLQAAIAACPPGGKVGLMLLDLDHFKEVNDTLGHHTGDLLLQRIGDRLAHTLRPDDIVARLGGDEFTILLPDVTRPEQVLSSAERMRETLVQPFQLGALSLEVGGSVGVAWYPDHGATPATLFQCADVAMYAAKLRRSGVERYDASRDPHSPRRLQLLGQLRSAIDTGRLFVQYQPMVDLPSGRVVGVEALARWDHPEHGLVAPDEFIPLAEHGGFIRPLTDRVLRTALEQCRRWTAQGLDLHVAVNLSVRTLLDPELPDHVQRLLTEIGVPADRLRLEITESCMVVDPALTAKVLNRLADVGVGLAIDDFGTGYSSLSSLRGLPVDEIKIDRSFVNTMSTDHHDAVIVGLAVELGANLGLRVVAEGVEDAGTSKRLAALGCDLAQGYFFGAAMGPRELEDLMRGAGARAGQQ
jgi:diguanylate cyclase (GGDEF)-like protein